MSGSLSWCYNFSFISSYAAAFDLKLGFSLSLLDGGECMIWQCIENSHRLIVCSFILRLQCSVCKSDLGGSEAGAEVRIRNQQLYCNSCYVRLKSRPDISTV